MAGVQLLQSLCMRKHCLALSIDNFYKATLVKEGHRGSSGLYVSRLPPSSWQCMMWERVALDSSITTSTLTPLYHLWIWPELSVKLRVRVVSFIAWCNSSPAWLREVKTRKKKIREACKKMPVRDKFSNWNDAWFCPRYILRVFCISAWGCR